MKHTLAMTIAALALTASAAGQGVVAPQPVPVQGVMERQAIERAAVESRTTTGAPYSAESVTESVQVLADGNRIARKTTTRIYRDSEGRTRREQLSTTGEVRSVSINDPVAGSTYLLNPADRTAQRNHAFVALPVAGVTRGRGSITASGVLVGSDGAVMTVTTARPVDGSAGAATTEEEIARRREVEAQAVAAGAAGGGVAVARGGGGGRGRGNAPATGTVAYPAEAVSLPRTVAPSGFAGGGGNVNKEDLGTQVVEGVVASGTRTTTTIPAGTIGNEQPIVIVSEQWFSPELKVLVMTKHTDPRTGETTYRVTNIVQAEPARSLFEVPADYTLKESVIRHQSPMPPPE